MDTYSLQKKKTADLVTFTEEILNGKLHFLCSVHCSCKNRQFLKDIGGDVETRLDT